MKALATFALVAGATLLPTFQAHAWLKFCNKTSDTVSVAYKHYLADCNGAAGWRSRGYWNIAPGECATVQSGTLQSSSLSRYYYYRAISASGAVWEGDSSITWNRDGKPYKDDSCMFAECILADGTPCYVQLPARKIDIGKNDNFTVDLSI